MSEVLFDRRWHRTSRPSTRSRLCVAFTLSVCACLLAACHTPRAEISVFARLIDEVEDRVCGAVRVVEQAERQVNGETVSVLFLGCNATSIGARFVQPAHARAQLVYTAMIVQAAAAFLRPSAEGAPRRALCLGLGAGAVPTTWRSRHGMSVDVVERSPAVVLLASRFFGYDASHGAHGRTVIGDAFDVLRTGGEEKGGEERIRGERAGGEREGGSLLRASDDDTRYDLILADFFDGTEGEEEQGDIKKRISPREEEPAREERALSPLLLQRLKQRWLAPDGVLVLNLLAALGPAAAEMRAPAERASAVLSRAFANVRVFADHTPTSAETAPNEPDTNSGEAIEACNLVFFASDGPLELRLSPALLRAARAAEAAGEEGGEARILEMLERQWEVPALSSRLGGWATREPPTAAQAAVGSARAAASMAAVQRRLLPEGVYALLAGEAAIARRDAASCVT
ncbi:hypothetical protein T492DRAFT_1039041 [Pavlovales sp. CCMP2436]|nr:hypothetical protein T492DRAFT_1039041 [Pavlovales sp. CCMP2436]